MKQLLILGAGSAGTMLLNHLSKTINAKEWQITIIDQSKLHYYQPGFLFLPFDIYSEKDVIKEGNKFIPPGCKLIQAKIEKIFPGEQTVKLEDGQEIRYDILVIATGSQIAPQEVEGMLGESWQKNIFDFYTFEGAVNLRNFLRKWNGGKMVVHITEMPIKCPVAPLEFAFLADWYFTRKGIRNKVDITYVTPLSGAFTKPIASKKLGYLLSEKSIKIVPDFAIERVDTVNKKIISYDDIQVPYDLLVTVPTNMGDEAIARSGIGDDLNFVPTNKHTLQSKTYDNIFVVGDATDIPTSKAGSVAHFEAEIVVKNILSYMKNQPLRESFDGHANCFVETGFNKAMLIDFNYDHQPTDGVFPIKGIGPLPLLKESRLPHWGKHAFKWIYWNMLLKGRKVPFISPNMSKDGKNLEEN
ncbi:FAD/NAD(P)-binding oxidoreductase [Fulvivirgaceae bacterium BMA10]|uniref:FAD/NAD(P)-binding oxidoreductase n=1 Tax=Splendidivirga corallicola TaxID=3051826 RepID=A0ABT8KWS9_9BACT|nr:FAD/NAD(P)-binding oxidoreductase [Fulvivirgaceae bacterium BMA10]